MTKKTFAFATSLVLLALPFLSASAQSINIELNQQIFKPGEKIEAKVSFTNPTEKQLKGQLTLSFTSLNPDFVPTPLVEEFDLKAKERSKTFVFDMTVDEWMPEGAWQAYAEVRNEEQKLLAKAYKGFAVRGTKKAIKAGVSICSSEDCSERKAVFTKGETVYVKVNSDIAGLEISSTVKTPSGEIESLSFENNLASFKSEETGSFSLWINFAKEGYSDQKIEKDFAYIEKAVKIPSSSICNQDGKCTGKENSQNCPQDCTSEAVSEWTRKNALYKIAIVGFVLIAAAAAIIIFILRKRRGKAGQIKQ